MRGDTSYFVDAEITRDGKRHRFTKREGDRLVSRTNYWHGEGDPSSWLCAAAFQRMRAKHGSLSQDDVLVLVAAAMQIAPRKLRESIAWHEQYVRWHDGMPEYYVLESAESEEP